MTTATKKPEWTIALGGNVQVQTLSFAGEIGTVTSLGKNVVNVSLINQTTGKRFEIVRLRKDLVAVDLGPADEPVFVGYFER